MRRGLALLLLLCLLPLNGLAGAFPQGEGCRIFSRGD